MYKVHYRRVLSTGFGTAMNRIHGQVSASILVLDLKLELLFKVWLEDFKIWILYAVKNSCWVKCKLFLEAIQRLLIELQYE